MGLNRLAAGNTVYGFGRPHPTAGPVDPLGYRERDMKMKAHKGRRNALLRRLKAKQKQKFMSADYLQGEK